MASNHLSVHDAMDALAASKEVFDNWKRSKEEDLSRLLEVHAKGIETDKENIHALDQKEKVFREKAQVLERTIEGEKSEEQEVLKQRNEMIQAYESLKLQNEGIQRDVKELQVTLDEQKKSVEHHGQMNSEQMNELRKIISLYRERLALTLERAGDNHMRFAFNNVDPTNYAREFVVSIEVNDADEYIVHECIPAVHDIGTLVKTLNETNNLSGFMVSIRQAFKATVM